MYFLNNVVCFDYESLHWSIPSLILVSVWNTCFIKSTSGGDIETMSKSIMNVLCFVVPDDFIGHVKLILVPWMITLNIRWNGGVLFVMMVIIWYLNEILLPKNLISNLNISKSVDVNGTSCSKKHNGESFHFIF